MGSAEKAPVPKSSSQLRTKENGARQMTGVQPVNEGFSLPVIQGESILLRPESVKSLQRIIGNQATTALLTHHRLTQPGASGSRRAGTFDGEIQMSPESMPAAPGVRASGLQSDVVRIQAGPSVLAKASGAPHIQRWINQGIGGLYSQKGHEAITEVSTAGWKKDLEKQIKDLEKQKKGLKGRDRERIESKITALRDEMVTLVNVRKGASFNDYVHATTSMKMIEEQKWDPKKKEEEQSLSYHMAEGRLIFIHAMAKKVSEEAWRTQHKVMMWAEFTYRVAVGDILPSTHLGELEINVEKDFVGGPTLAALLDPWKDQTVGWLFTGVEDTTQHSNAQGIALGSLLHMLQDSFCMAHAQREVARRSEAKARLIKNFNFYLEQSHNPILGMHRKADVLWGFDWLHSAEKRVHKTAGAWEAAEAGTRLITYFRGHKPWSVVKGYLLGIFGLSPELEAQKPKNREWGKEESEPGGKRLTSGAGRLFRGSSILDQFKRVFDINLINSIDKRINDSLKETGLVKSIRSIGTKLSGWFEPKKVRNLRNCLVAYNRLLDIEKNSFTVPYKPAVRVEKFINPEAMAILDALPKVDAAMEYYSEEKSTKNKADLISALAGIKKMLDEDYNEVRLDAESLISMGGSQQQA